MNRTQPATSTDDDAYWGGADIEKWTPFCTSRTFIHEDTTNNGWDSVHLQERYCKVAVGEDTDSTVIEDAIVISHSMGNLVFAAAVKKGLCSLGESSRWYAASAPWNGSKAATWVEGLCADIPGASTALKWLARKLNYCDPNTPQHATRAYITMQAGYQGLSDLVDVAVKHVAGAMCGTSGYGITSKYSVSLEALSVAVAYGEDNDGMVAISSCMLPGKHYGGKPSEVFYKASINHADGTCQSGNGDFGIDSRQPATWYASMGKALATRPLRGDVSVLV